jgi:uncharacterized protein YhjY with autotransporter beta-barrel domain
MASNFYRAQDSPKYLLGHGLDIGFVTLGLLAVAGLRWNYSRINKMKEREDSQGAGLSDTEIAQMGDRAPTFRYVI